MPGLPAVLPCMYLQLSLARSQGRGQMLSCFVIFPELEEPLQSFRSHLLTYSSSGQKILPTDFPHGVQQHG